MVSLGHLRPCWGNWGCIGEIEAMSGLCWALCCAINPGTNGFARGEGLLNTTSPKRFYSSGWDLVGELEGLQTWQWFSRVFSWFKVVQSQPVLPGPSYLPKNVSTKNHTFPMTLQNDVLNPGPLLNQHPRKACKSMRARVGRPCCGGYPCQPPKMHQISKEVVRDWSLWGSWCFSIFLMISRNLLRQEDARRQKLLLHVLMWMMLMNAYECLWYL